MTWNIQNGQLVQGDVGNAPTYNNPFFTFQNQAYLNPAAQIDPALMMTLGAGNSGGAKYGLEAFLNHGSDEDSSPLNQGGTDWNTQDLKGLAAQFGLSQDGTKEELVSRLQDATKDYYAINGMSSGWNPTGDARGANLTLYRSQDGKLIPVQTGSYSAPQKSLGFLGDHPGILAPVAVATGGLLSAYLGAGAGASGAASGGVGAGAEGAGGIGGMSGSFSGGAGAAGAGSTSITQSIANALGFGNWWSGLPSWGQGMLSGAAQGGIKSGLTGGNPITGAISGAVSGGISGPASGFLSGIGVPDGLAGVLGRGIGSLGGGLAGGLAGGSAGSPGGSGGGSSGGGLAGLLGGSAGPTGTGVGSLPSVTNQSSSAGMLGGLNDFGVGGVNDVRQALLSKQLASKPDRAGDSIQDNPLVRALQSATA